MIQILLIQYLIQGGEPHNSIIIYQCAKTTGHQKPKTQSGCQFKPPSSSGLHNGNIGTLVEGPWGIISDVGHLHRTNT